MSLDIEAIIRKLWQILCGVFLGHDWFNGGESCRDCRKPRPKGYKP